jgi:hypothetical protein
VYQPTGTAAYDTQYQNLLNSSIANNPYTANTGNAQSVFNDAFNNPYATPYQSAANNAGQAYNTGGNQAVQAGGQISNASTASLPAASQVLNTAFDPQNQLYAQKYQQMLDTNNVNLAQSGTTASPYGASVTNQTENNFNTTWQQQQLANQLSGLSGYGTSVNQSAQGANTGAALQNTGAGMVVNGGAVPFNAVNTVTNNQSQALQNLLGVTGNSGQGAYTTQQLSDLMAYLGLGTGQGNIQAGINQQAQQNAQSGIGNLLGVGMEALANYGAEAAVVAA